MIYLASQSPRRRELLTQIGVPFEAFSVDIDETPAAGERPEQLVSRLALEKARAGRAYMRERQWAERPVLGADTVVVSDGEALGKPRNQGDAADMLARLSGRSHQVLSSVALISGSNEWLERVATTVHFRPIGRAEIKRYWSTGEPRDKAGGYGIQGAAAVFVRAIEGSYSGVVGLPLCQTAELLCRAGVDYWHAAAEAGVDNAPEDGQ